MRPVPCTAKPTWWPTSQRSAAVRSTPVSPTPACGAAIQPASASRVMTTSPLPAAAHAAMAPVTTSGRVGAGGPPAPSRPPARSAGGAEAVIRPILATAGPRIVEGRRAPGPAGRLAAPHPLTDEAGRLGRCPADPHPDLLQRFLLGLRRARRTGDDRACVPHGLAFRGGEARHVGDHGL